MKILFIKSHAKKYILNYSYECMNILYLGLL